VYVVPCSLLDILGLYRLSICPTWNARGSSICGVGRTTLESSTGGAWYCLCAWFAGALDLLPLCRTCFGRDDCPSGPVGWAYGQASPARHPVAMNQRLHVRAFFAIVAGNTVSFGCDVYMYALHPSYIPLVVKKRQTCFFWAFGSPSISVEFAVMSAILDVVIKQNLFCLMEFLQMC